MAELAVLFINMPPNKKTFEELAEAKNIKPDTLKTLLEGDYDSVAAVTTLTGDQINELKCSPAQKGLLKKWVEELNSKPAHSASKKAGASKVSMADLRADESLLDQVDKRLKDLGLTDGESDSEDSPQPKKGKISSGRSKTVADVVCRHVQWPHYYIFRGHDRQTAQYDNLTLPEFVYGFLCMIQEAKSDTQPALIEHLAAMMADAREYPWPSVRNFNGVIMQLYEQDRFEWGENTSSLREHYLRIPAPAQDKPQLQVANVTRPPRTRITPALQYCGPFQSGMCRETADEHDSPRGTVHHICAFCLKKAGKPCAHPEVICKRKNYTQPMH